jgi:ATP-binding cassette, subfamily B, bacterial
VFNVVSGLRYTRVSADILFDMRLDVYRHLQRLSPRFWADTRLGDIVSRINNDIGEVQRVTADSALGWLGNVVYLVGTVTMLLLLDARLFLVSLIALPPSLWALVRYRRRLETSVRVLRERSADIGSFLIETLLGMRLVVSSNAQEREAVRFRERNDAFVRSLMSMRMLTYLAGGLPALLLAGGTAAVFLYGGSRVISGAMTLGTFVAFMAYQMRLLAPVQGLMGIYANLASARASLIRVNDLLDSPAEVSEPADALILSRVDGTIDFEHVRFGYGDDRVILDDVTLRIPAGQVVALVGASGSGKSTLTDLLVRNLDPETGRVLLDGNDLRTLSLTDLRHHIAVVDQDPFVFHTTIAENVRYTRPSATDAEVRSALEAAGLGSLVDMLPDGMDTIVGERGRRLSAGERQRLAVARAFLADAAVLVLDEATGSLDPAAEAHVLAGYASLTRGRTAIMITHRPAVARRADRIILIRDGRVVADGAPADLAARDGAFHALFGPAAGDEELAPVK